MLAFFVLALDDDTRLQDGSGEQPIRSGSRAGRRDRWRKIYPAGSRPASDQFPHLQVRASPPRWPPKCECGLGFRFAARAGRDGRRFRTATRDRRPPPREPSEISLKPPSSVALWSRISIFHRLVAAWCLYISYRSRANRAASSPPVPARISMMQRVRLASSPPRVSSSNSFHSFSRFSTNSGISAAANSRSSASWSLGHFTRAVDLVDQLLKAAIFGCQAAQRAMLACNGSQSGRIGENLGIDKKLLQLLKSAQFFF